MRSKATRRTGSGVPWFAAGNAVAFIGIEWRCGVVFSRRRHSWTHVAYQVVASGGGSSGARDGVGPASATSRCNVGGGSLGRVSAMTWGDGAWHVPQPQSTPRSLSAAERIVGWPPLEFEESLALTISDAQVIIGTSSPSSADKSGSKPEQPKHQTVSRPISPTERRRKSVGRRSMCVEHISIRPRRNAEPPVATWLPDDYQTKQPPTKMSDGCFVA